MTKETIVAPAGYLSSASASWPSRRAFGEADKQRLLAEASAAGATISGVARRYGIAARVLFRWRQELEAAAETEPQFLSVKVSDSTELPDTIDAALPGATASMPDQAPAAVIDSGAAVDASGGDRLAGARAAPPAHAGRLSRAGRGRAGGLLSCGPLTQARDRARAAAAPRIASCAWRSTSRPCRTMSRRCTG